MTTFVHCRGCGAQIHETAPTCPKCGAPQMVPNTSRTQMPPSATAAGTHAQERPAELSEKWIEKFKLIDNAGGADLPGKKNLTASECKRVEWNVWAALFSWVYYFAKGMWKKGLTYLVIVVVGLFFSKVIFEALFGISLRGLAQAEFMSQLVMFVAMIFLSGRSANRDYYKKVKHGWNAWW
jgi:hypothetical protein